MPRRVQTQVHKDSADSYPDEGWGIVRDIFQPQIEKIVALEDEREPKAEQEQERDFYALIDTVECVFLIAFSIRLCQLRVKRVEKVGAKRTERTFNLGGHPSRGVDKNTEIIVSQQVNTTAGQHTGARTEKVPTHEVRHLFHYALV